MANLGLHKLWKLDALYNCRTEGLTYIVTDERLDALYNRKYPFVHYY
jgi:hypothetical protein